MSRDLKELIKTSKSLRLLYVEDEESARNATLKLLMNFFDNITAAVDGQDGLEKFKEGEFDFIITDISMPKINGIEMIKLIREQTPQIPVILLSAHGDSGKFLQAIELDVDAYVLKPVVYDKFISSLKKTIRKIEFLRLNENYKKELEAEVQKRNKELEYKLHYDPLTDLCSRYSFFSDLKNINSPIVFLIDIDKFRVINEVYGTALGSKVLQEFARVLKENIKDDKYRLYRLSADEFAIIDMDDYTDYEKHEVLIEKLFENLNNLEIIVDKNIVHVDITIGISAEKNNTYESAKIALDYAKKHKKRYVMYSNSIDYRKESSQTLKCIENISLAINENRVVNVFQPIVGKDGKIVKYETLMRLKDRDTQRLITPYEFLDVALKTRLYEYLSTKIIFNALDVISNTGSTISINVTYSDIKNSELLHEIEKFIKANKNTGPKIVFEITENESIENYDDVKKFINRFRKHGVKIAIDDFGTGFSNFEYILEIAPEYLKIDGSLIKEIDTNERSHTLVEAIVQFSHKLGIKVIAEYVHSEIIFDMLKELDIDEYQGYYFSEPLEEIKE